MPGSGLFSTLLNALLDIVDASEAAVVVVVVPMQRPGIPVEGKCESLHILLEIVWAHSVSLRHERVRDLTVITLLPRHWSQQALQPCGLNSLGIGDVWKAK